MRTERCSDERLREIWELAAEIEARDSPLTFGPLLAAIDDLSHDLRLARAEVARLRLGVPGRALEVQDQRVGHIKRPSPQR